MCQKLKFYIIFLFLIQCWASSWPQQFCKPELCQDNEPHVGCHNQGKFGTACNYYKKVKVILDTPKLRRDILDLINNYRSRTAKGEVFGYEPAARMATVEWDYDLAKLAQFNVKRCHLQQDQCRNTDNFKFVGQAVGYYAWPNATLTVKAILKATFRSWFHEYAHCSMKIINDYKLPPNDTVYGHFAQMIHDQSTHIGCSIMRMFKQETCYQYMTCNFARSIITGMRIYETGATASGCKTGTNPIYPNLCSVHEKFNVNAY